MTEIRHKILKLLLTKQQKICQRKTLSKAPISQRPVPANSLLKRRALHLFKDFTSCSCSFATTTTTKPTNTTNIKPIKPENSAFSVAALAKRPIGFANQIVVKKRLSAIFDNYELIIVWASIEPIAKKIWREVFFNFSIDKNKSSKIVETDGNDFRNRLDLAVKQAFSLQKQNIKQGKLPKDTLNNHCTNINLRMIGCGINFLAIKSLPKGTTLLNYFKASNAHQIAEILAVLSNTDKTSQKLHSPSQLLGAFIKDRQISNSLDNINAKGSVEQLLKHNSTERQRMIFIGGYELRQSLILRQSLFYGILCKQLIPSTFSEAKVVELQLYSGIAISVKKVVKKPLKQINKALVKLNKVLISPTKKFVKLSSRMGGGETLRFNFLKLIYYITLVAKLTTQNSKKSVNNSSF